jgi:hypothetical protein
MPAGIFPPAAAPAGATAVAGGLGESKTTAMVATKQTMKNIADAISNLSFFIFYNLLFLLFHHFTIRIHIVNRDVLQ